jgi:uncharacterized protein YpuA (DUF1002 family)
MGAIEERIALTEKFRLEAITQIYTELFDQNYRQGFLAHKKETEKVLRDTSNKYKSKLSEEQTPKLGKILNKEKIKVLETKILVIKEIQKKLL